MNLLTRSRDQLILGVWALTPVAVVVLLFLTWPHVDDGSRYYTPYSPGYSTPLTTGRLLELLGTIALVVVAAGMLLGDLWRRPLPRGLRKAWTRVIPLGAPFGGLAYWLLHGHGDATPTVPAAESA